MLIKIEDALNTVNQQVEEHVEQLTEEKVELVSGGPTAEEYATAPEPVVDAEVLAEPTPSKPVFAGLKLKSSNA